jgi:pimeloyl-ACP methyl ester carboxylesterase
MPIAASNGIEIYYETHGDPNDPALLLVHGFTAQITGWSDGFREGLAARGFFVISFDNRDVGLSTHLDGQRVDVTTVLAAVAGRGVMPDVPYTLSAFAADAVGLLDHLGIASAHIAGASMGGMIVQTIAIEYPERVRTMTSIMSTTGEKGYFESTKEATKALMTAPPSEREAFIASSIERSRVFASPRYFEPAEAATMAARSFDRAYYPEGATRQLGAIHASAPRADALRALRIPTLVLHGRADTLILPIGGERTAELIPGANLMMMNDMGHDLPRPLWPLIFDAIVSHTHHAIG